MCWSVGNLQQIKPVALMDTARCRPHHRPARKRARSPDEVIEEACGQECWRLPQHAGKGAALIALVWPAVHSCVQLPPHRVASCGDSSVGPHHLLATSALPVYWDEAYTASTSLPVCDVMVAGGGHIFLASTGSTTFAAIMSSHAA